MIDTLIDRLQEIDFHVGGAVDRTQIDNTLQACCDEHGEDICHYAWDDGNVHDAIEIIAAVWFICWGNDRVNEWFWSEVVPYMCEQLEAYDYEFLSDPTYTLEATRDQVYWVLTHNCGFNSYFAWLNTWNDDDDAMMAQALDRVQRANMEAWNAAGYPDSLIDPVTPRG